MATYYKGRKYYDFPPLEWYDEHPGQSYCKRLEMDKDTHNIDYPWFRFVWCGSVSKVNGVDVCDEELVWTRDDKTYMKRDDETEWTLPDGRKTHQITIYLVRKEFPQIARYCDAFRAGMAAIRYAEEFYGEVTKETIISSLVNLEMG